MRREGEKMKNEKFEVKITENKKKRVDGEHEGKKKGIKVKKEIENERKIRKRRRR